MFAAIFLAVFSALGLWPVMSAYATELFPTEIRGQATAWIRNVFEIAGTISGPALVGVLGDHRTGPIGTIGGAVSVLTLAFLPVLWLIWRHLPDSGGRLEEAALNPVTTM